MKAYVTLLGTNDFIQGTLTLWQSLQNVCSQYPLVVIINSTINKMNRYILDKRGIKYYEMENLAYPDGTTQNMIADGWPEGCVSNFASTIQKFHIFKLIEYEKLVYLDSDMLVLKNIDCLFDRPNKSAVVDCGVIYKKYPEVFVTFDEEGYDGLNSGLLVVEPNLQDYENIMKLMKENPNCDQTIFRRYWTEWKTNSELQLPSYMNAYVPYIPLYINSGIYDIKDIAVLHYIGIKPFRKEKLDLLSTEGFLNKLYMEIEKQSRQIVDGVRPLLFEGKIFEVPVGGYSYPYFKNFARMYIKSVVPENSTILDIGCGQGIYAQMLRKFYIMDGVDIYPEHNNEFTQYLYRNVYTKDIRSFKYDWYDLVIMGDVLEHLPIEDGQEVIEYAKNHSNFILVVVPYCQEQVFTEGNTAETHLQPDITHEIFLERYPGFMKIKSDKYHGYYFWRRD